MLSSSLLDYQRNKQEIENIQGISEELSRLQELEWQRDASQTFYLTAQATHYYRENIKLEQAIREMSVSYTETCWKTLFIRQQEGSIELEKREKELEDFLADTKALEQLRHDVVNNEQELNKCTREKEELESKHTQAQTQSQRLERVQEWLQPHDGSVEKLQQEFEQQNQIVREYEQLKEFIGYLTNHNLLEDFEFSLWSQDFDKAKREAQARLTVLVKELDKLEVAKSFYDINNPNSLARWAINQGKPLTQEQENILIHFQKLPRSEEVREEGERYLPQPETLFDNIVLKNKQEDGFWLEVGAVYEFILSKPQILPLTDSAELKELLEKAQLDAVAEYELLNKEKTNIERLLEGLSDYHFQVNLFQKRHALKTFVVNASLLTSQREFDDALQLLGQAREIQKAFDELNQAYLALQKKLEKLKIRQGVLKEQISAKEQSISAKNQAILETRIDTKKNEMASWKKEETELNTLKTPSDIEGEIKTQLDKIQLEDRSSALKALLEQCLRTEGKLEEELRNLESRIPLVKDSLEKALASYKEILALEFELDETMAVVDLEQAKSEAQRASDAFKHSYETLVNNTIKNETRRFHSTTDIGLLAHMLLPKIFSSPRVEGLDIGKGIADYLNSINEKNRQINQGKAQFLSDTFEKVKDRYNHYANLVNDLKRFFKSDDTLITGGFRVSLSLNQSKKYPIEWMNGLRRSLQEWRILQTDLFKSNTGSPEDVILKTFGQYTDHSVSDKDIKALLDPKSYFDLSFSLENDGGTTQGSTGQAYTAIALLCIARLSLIEDEGKRGVRFMPIDEAEGIGSNYETLYNLALKYDYQVVSMSIRNVEGIEEAKQNLYILYANPNSELGVNYDPYSDLSYGRLETQNWRKSSK